MADEPLTDERLSDEQLAEIRASLAETKAAMDDWYQAHPNPQWRREHPFDYDNMIANTYTYITMPALLAEIDLRRAREASAMAIVREVAQNDMVIPLAGSVRCVFWDCEYDGISDHSPNCPWMKARALLTSEEVR